MHITIHEAATAEEWEQGCALLRTVYVEGGFTAEEAAQRLMTRDTLETGGVFLLAKHANEIVGGVLFLHENSVLTQIAQSGEREFRVLGVPQRARGAGVGEALVNECITRAKAQQARALVLWTQPTMKAAQHLYEKLGFVRDPSHDMPDQRGFTRLVYVLKLAGAPA
jgi:ribosomal protein S18 acetylase RimI-like enzyme